MNEVSNHQATPPTVSTPPPPPPPLPVVCKPILSSEALSVSYELLAEAQDEWMNSVRSNLQHLPTWKQSCEDPAHNWIWMVCNKSVSSIIQKREQPVCGMLALGMASEMLSLPWKDIWDVVAEAKKQGYTCYGEMFSAKWLLHLATSQYGMTGYVLGGNLLTQMDVVTKHLANGYPVLIAYDTDCNYEPCCRRGHKAHWAILTGFIFKVKQEDLTPEQLSQIKQDKILPNLYHIPNKTALDIKDYPKPSDTEDIFVIAKQGKSKRYGVWSYKALCDSNANLQEFSPVKEADEKNYVIPNIGVKAGLANQAIMLQPP